TLVGNCSDVEGGFVIGLIERRKCATRVGGLELGGGVLASVIILAKIKPAHLAVENARVCNVNGGWTRRQRLLDSKHGHLFTFLGRHLSVLHARAAGDGDG